MDENVNDVADEVGGNNSRRDLLKKAAIGGAVVWAAPTVLAGTAGAAVGSVKPPECTFNSLGMWSTVTVNTPPGYASFGGLITGTDWSGTNIDVVGPAFPGTPGWISSNWLDLVGSGTQGSITATFQLPCDGTYRLSFGYSQSRGSTGTTVDVKVGGGPTVTLPTAIGQAAATPFTADYPLGGSVTITITGHGAGNIGPALGDITFYKI